MKDMNLWAMFSRPSKSSSHMPFHVQGEVVAPGERSLAELALERSVPSVFPVVTGQFIRAGELPTTALPVAVVGLLPGVGPHVSLEVGALGVGLAAARVGTGVCGLSLPSPGSASTLLGLRSGLSSHGTGVQGHQEVHELGG